MLVPSLIQRFGEGGASLPLEPDEQPPALVARGFEGGGFEMSLAAFFSAMLELGLKWLVVTDGKNGAFVASQEGLVHSPTVPCDVAGTAGAGDAFSATFSAALAEGRTIDSAIAAAMVNAASVIGHVDTQTGLLDGKELEKKSKAAQSKLALRRWSL